MPCSYSQTVQFGTRCLGPGCQHSTQRGNNQVSPSNRAKDDRDDRCMARRTLKSRGGRVRIEHGPRGEWIHPIRLHFRPMYLPCVPTQSCLRALIFCTFQRFLPASACRASPPCSILIEWFFESVQREFDTWHDPETAHKCKTPIRTEIGKNTKKKTELATDYRPQRPWG